MQKNLIIIALFVIAVAGLYFLYNFNNQSFDKLEKDSMSTPSNSEEQVFCTLDAKQCPDGSYVGRVAPDCEFELCPSEKMPTPKPINNQTEDETEADLIKIEVAY